ncbi:MAG: hypothetical protein KA978_01715 [Deltaproteobacteria bacterium]|nr:hypothetical protein [Deltaproteobacteria bacterium]MBP6829465.1 hypothetical protein [Deltaproteobacteria bacterium]
MRSLALDPTTGDLLLTAGRLTLVEGVEAVAQRIKGRLTLWAGEWFADTSLGIPFLSFLGAKGGEKLAESTLRRAILSCPGVASLESFSFTADARTRSAVIAFRVRTTDGQVVEDGGFRVGA